MLFSRRVMVAFRVRMVVVMHTYLYYLPPCQNFWVGQICRIGNGDKQRSVYDVRKIQ